jgi:DNA-binding GntR family transcriptional regulator
MPDPALRHLESSTLADRAYEAIREAIVSGELAPQEKITERGLAMRLAVSVTPIREALRRLEQDQLVERTGPRTVQVANFDDRAVREIRLAEGALRAVAARLAATNATEDQLAHLEQLLDRGDHEIARLTARASDAAPSMTELRPLLDITRTFHAGLNAACNNPMVLRLLSMVDAFDLAARPHDLTAEMRRDHGRAALERYREHRQLLDVIRSRDAGAAEQMMREHTRTHGLDDL